VIKPGKAFLKNKLPITQGSPEEKNHTRNTGTQLANI
jgi:hypothetical protein